MYKLTVLAFIEIFPKCISYILTQSLLVLLLVCNYILDFFYYHFYILILYTKINSTIITSKTYGCLFIHLNCVDWPLN